MQTTTNNIATTQQLSDYLFKKGVHHYQDTITPSGSFVPRETIEIPIAMIAANDGYKFFNALNVCLELIESGIHLVKSNCNNFLYLTVRGSVVAENN